MCVRGGEAARWRGGLRAARRRGQGGDLRARWTSAGAAWWRRAAAPSRRRRHEGGARRDGVGRRNARGAPVCGRAACGEGGVRRFGGGGVRELRGCGCRPAAVRLSRLAVARGGARRRRGAPSRRPARCGGCRREVGRRVAWWRHLVGKLQAWAAARLGGLAVYSAAAAVGGRLASTGRPIVRPLVSHAQLPHLCCASAQLRSRLAMRLTRSGTPRLLAQAAAAHSRRDRTGPPLPIDGSTDPRRGIGWAR